MTLSEVEFRFSGKCTLPLTGCFYDQDARGKTIDDVKAEIRSLGMGPGDWLLEWSMDDMLNVEATLNGETVLVFGKTKDDIRREIEEKTRKVQQLKREINDLAAEVEQAHE